MPAMTMAIRVADHAFAERVKPGDRIRFKAGMVNGLSAATQGETVR